MRIVFPCLALVLVACIKVTSGQGQVLCDGSPCADDPSGGGSGSIGGGAVPGNTGLPGTPGTAGTPPPTDPGGALDAGVRPGECPAAAGTGPRGTVSAVGGTGPFVGAAQSVSFSGQDGVAVTASGQDGVAVITRWATLTLAFTAYTNACGYNVVDGMKKGGQVFVVSTRLQSNTRSVVSFTPGTYPATGSASGSADPQQQPVMSVLVVSNATCGRQSLPVRAPATGSLTLRTVSSTRIAGSVSITGQNGDRIAGDFDVPVCPSASQQASQGGGATGDLSGRCCLP